MSDGNQANLSHVQLLEHQLHLARREINNLRQQLITLKHVHRKECDEIYKRLNEFKCSECQSNQNERENAAASTSSVTAPSFMYIGQINTHFPEKRGTPRQPGISSESIAKLTISSEVFTNPAHALEGLQEFSHMWILFHFHRNDSTHIHAKVAPPRLNGIRMGVFATRSPHRPSPIGLSLVKINHIENNVIYFNGVDMVDQTPVLDIKPYIPRYDNPDLTNIFHLEDGLIDNERSVRNEGNGVIYDRELQEITDVLDNANIRVMDGEENGSRNDVVLGAVSQEISNPRPALEESLYARSNSRIGEREAPDGEEEESPRQSRLDPLPVPAGNTQEGNIRVPEWIEQPAVSSLVVLFKDRALAQLSQLGPEGEEKKTIITNVLREDPRSIYLRERWGSHCYVFRIAELCVSCKFNDATHCVTVYQVFQNAANDCDE